MSAAATLGEADAKFPNQTGQNDIPPSPTRENPGAVFPKSSPTPAEEHSVPGTGGSKNPRSLFSNPFEFNSQLLKVEFALSDLIAAVENEERSGVSSEGMELISKFKIWRDEVGQLRVGQLREGQSKLQGGAAPAQHEILQGGLFTD